MIMGMALVDGKVIAVAKATEERDHGKPFYLCSTMSGNQTFHFKATVDDVKEWMKSVGAESVFNCEEIR